MAIESSPPRTRMRFAHALLVVLLLLTTTGSILHPYALDAHRDGHLCSVCLASAHGSGAPPPEVHALVPPCVATPAAPLALRFVDARVSTPYLARAPPA